MTWQTVALVVLLLILTGEVRSSVTCTHTLQTVESNLSSLQATDDCQLALFVHTPTISVGFSGSPDKSVQASKP